MEMNWWSPKPHPTGTAPWPGQCRLLFQVPPTAWTDLTPSVLSEHSSQRLLSGSDGQFGQKPSGPRVSAPTTRSRSEAVELMTHAPQSELSACLDLSFHLNCSANS